MSWVDAGAPAIPTTVRQCPVCHELMADTDWMRLPRFEIAGKFGKTIKVTCPECRQQSISIRWTAKTREPEAI